MIQTNKYQKKDIQVASEHLKMIELQFLGNYKIKPHCDITSKIDKIGKIDNKY